MFSFLQNLLNDYIKSKIQHIEKVFYIIDGSNAQYKNYKNFINLILHEQDFDLKAEWHFFFATSHRKKLLRWFSCLCKSSETNFKPNLNTTIALLVYQRGDF